ncbi:MAG: succinate-semialdehyde dehydrogenase / glutarate-semialdehyde dehydrogenase [Mycobacterium sp.]|jgi:hypothetical protein|nr:succinate-semialdehyde dehydrogenase / glutarate-semialdehyde dehydrogenase [Mycobacterium sp.]
MAYSGVHTDIVGVSAFITCGLHDEVTVSCSHTLAKGIPHNEFLIFGNGSHMSGQSCIAANRILAQRGIHDAFVEGLTEMMGLIDDRALASMARLVADAPGLGATVLTDVPPASLVAATETFGSIAAKPSE